MLGTWRYQACHHPQSCAGLQGPHCSHCQPSWACSGHWCAIFSLLCTQWVVLGAWSLGTCSISPCSCPGPTALPPAPFPLRSHGVCLHCPALRQSQPASSHSVPTHNTTNASSVPECMEWQVSAAPRLSHTTLLLGRQFSPSQLMGWARPGTSPSTLEKS